MFSLKNIPTYDKKATVKVEENTQYNTEDDAQDNTKVDTEDNEMSVVLKVVVLKFFEML